MEIQSFLMIFIRILTSKITQKYYSDKLFADAWHLENDTLNHELSMMRPSDRIFLIVVASSLFQLEGVENTLAVV